jgi:hypothetical protein
MSDQLLAVTALPPVIGGFRDPRVSLDVEVRRKPLPLSGIERVIQLIASHFK